MSANVESMFSVREVPWHGLGIILPECPTSEDAIVAAGLDWSVEKKPIYNSDHAIIPGFYANTRSSDGSVFGVVTDKYSIVQNSQAFSFTDSLCDEGLRYETAGSLRGGKQVWLLGKMPEDKILDDKLEPYVCFTNTFDGTGSVRVVMTPVRVVCNNTLNLALSTAKRAWSSVHRGNIEGKLAEAKHTLGLINDYTEALKVEAELLAATTLSDSAIEGMLDTLYPTDENTSNCKRERLESLKASIFTCLDAEDVKPYRGTAYGALMAVTDYADHCKPIRSSSNFNENRWGTIIAGHPFVDQMYKLIKAA